MINHFALYQGTLIVRLHFENLLMAECVTQQILVLDGNLPVSKTAPSITLRSLYSLQTPAADPVA